MSAIITNQFRIQKARDFVAEVESSTNSYYTFIGLPNPTDLNSNWESGPPAPKDCFDEESKVWDTIIALKKINSDDVQLAIRKYAWQSGTVYDMYRPDINRDNLSKPSDVTNLYSAPYYVLNSDFRVYICLRNGVDPENPSGKPSLDEPTHTDLDPRAAGGSGDGYIWKYLYTLKPSEIIKFESINFIPVPKDWFTNTNYDQIRNHASTGGQIKVVTITNRGESVGVRNRVYTDIPISGDGTGAKCTIVTNNDSKVESITVTSGGSGYTFGVVDLRKTGTFPTAGTDPTFNVIIPPSIGHGYDIYRELGAKNVLLYSRIENDTENPDFTIGNKIARVGVVQNPQAYDSSSLLTLDKASGVRALVLKGPSGNRDLYQTTTFTNNALVTQTVGVGTTAVGRVVSYDNTTGVLKYWQDRTVAGINTAGQIINPTYGYSLNSFSAADGSYITVEGGSNNLEIDTDFGTVSNPGISTVINNRTYYLGQSFVKGVANPEAKQYSGEIIHIDNRTSITRSANQKEDIKIILQF